MRSLVYDLPHRVETRPAFDVEAERARLPWRARHIARKYNVGLPIASVVAELVFDVEARQMSDVGAWR
jgi:hypothetical protein